LSSFVRAFFRNHGFTTTAWLAFIFSHGNARSVSDLASGAYLETTDLLELRSLSRHLTVHGGLINRRFDPRYSTEKNESSRCPAAKLSRRVNLIAKCTRR